MFMGLENKLGKIFWNIFFRVNIKIFGFWPVYRTARSPKYLLCLILKHKWYLAEKFQIKPGDYSFGLNKCSRCDCDKWVK